MPSPIGHTLAGCAVTLAVMPSEMLQAWEAWALCLVCANLADVDFIPGLLTGNPRTFHRGPSHSLMAALVATGLGASFLTWSAAPWRTWAGLIFLAYASHVALDYFTPGRGVLLGWPLSRRRYQAARPWFLSVSPGRTYQDVWTKRGRRHLLRAIGREVLLLSPAIAVLALAKELAWLPR
jgi:LexA-binding, inner membrane-associated putative hydrolase